MRNKYAGTCYRCNERVEPGKGHFERHNGGWRTQHASCAITHRKGTAMKTAEEIAASLPSGQRAYLLGQLPNISHASARQVQGRLRRNGLWDSLINRPTPLGLRVRAILQKDQPNG